MNLRERSGKSREEVAELLGKSVKTIGHWETGYAQPDANTLFLLCTIYDADLNKSFGFASPQKESPDTGKSAPEEQISKIFDSLNQMLVSEGFIRDGDDLTEKQADILIGVCKIIEATFKD